MEILFIDIIRDNKNIAKGKTFGNECGADRCIYNSLNLLLDENERFEAPELFFIENEKKQNIYPDLDCSIINTFEVDENIYNKYLETNAHNLKKLDMCTFDIFIKDRLLNFTLILIKNYSEQFDKFNLKIGDKIIVTTAPMIIDSNCDEFCEEYSYINLYNEFTIATFLGEYLFIKEKYPENVGKLEHEKQLNKNDFFIKKDKDVIIYKKVIKIFESDVGFLEANTILYFKDIIGNNIKSFDILKENNTCKLYSINNITFNISDKLLINANTLFDDKYDVKTYLKYKNYFEAFIKVVYTNDANLNYNINI